MTDTYSKVQCLYRVETYVSIYLLVYMQYYYYY